MEKKPTTSKDSAKILEGIIRKLVKEEFSISISHRLRKVLTDELNKITDEKTKESVLLDLKSFILNELDILNTK